MSDAGNQASNARRLAGGLAGLRGRFVLLWAAFAAIVLFDATGISRLRFDDELMRFFNSDLAAWTDFVDVASNFESDNNDILVLFEAPDLADPAALTAIDDFLLDAQFLPGIRAAVSPLALETVGANGPEPLVPFPPPDRAAMAKRFDAARTADPTLGQMMSADRTAMVAVLPAVSFGEGKRGNRIALVDALHELATRTEAQSGLTVRLSGYSLLRDSVGRALVRDMIVLNAIGVAVGFLVSVIALRSVRIGLLTLPGAAMGALTTLGLFGHLGITINTVTVILPVLVVVLAASDTIHIAFERARQGGRDPARASIRAIRRVAMACLFAAGTTAVAFGALATSRADMIAEMGKMGALAVLASTLVVLLTETLALTIGARMRWFQPHFDRLGARPPKGWPFNRLPGLALAHPRPVAWTALGLLAISAALYSQAGPRYNLLDALRPSAEVVATFHEIEERVTPFSLIQVPVASGDPEVVARVHDRIAAITGQDNIRSIGHLETAARGEIVAGDLPEVLARRLVDESGSRALVSVPFTYTSGDDTLALAAKIDAGLAADPETAPLVGPATGISVMSARVADRVLTDINRSLLIALVAVALIIWIWLRDLRVALISLLPNMLPVTLIGAWLALSGRGIEFSNGLALTVAFGIAVDDTLHVLNRLRLSGGVTRVSRERLAEAMHEVTPALVTTSIMLIFGVGGTFFAETKSVADFGLIAIAVYLLALIADLLVLPAALIAFGAKPRETQP